MEVEMTFQEILAEVQKLSTEEKRLLVDMVWPEVEAQEVAQIFPMTGTLEIVTPVLGKGSLQPLYDLLEEANRDRANAG
jgi:hypothetical protein